MCKIISKILIEKEIHLPFLHQNVVSLKSKSKDKLLITAPFTPTHNFDRGLPSPKKKNGRTICKFIV